MLLVGVYLPAAMEFGGNYRLGRPVVKLVSKDDGETDRGEKPQSTAKPERGRSAEEAPESAGKQGGGQEADAGQGRVEADEGRPVFLWRDVGDQCLLKAFIQGRVDAIEREENEDRDEG